MKFIAKMQDNVFFGHRVAQYFKYWDKQQALCIVYV